MDFTTFAHLVQQWTKYGPWKMQADSLRFSCIINKIVRAKSVPQCKKFPRMFFAPGILFMLFIYGFI
jgi:hypothetical protein